MLFVIAQIYLKTNADDLNCLNILSTNAQP